MFNFALFDITNTVISTSLMYKKTDDVITSSPPYLLLVFVTSLLTVHVKD